MLICACPTCLGKKVNAGCTRLEDNWKTGKWGMYKSYMWENGQKLVVCIQQIRKQASADSSHPTCGKIGSGYTRLTRGKIGEHWWHISYKRIIWIIWLCMTYKHRKFEGLLVMHDQQTHKHEKEGNVGSVRPGTSTWALTKLNVITLYLDSYCINGKMEDVLFLLYT